uniref:Putative high-chlorophyll-fluorescence 101 n=1 Tax=Wolffia arrhiza TaxID=161111 RepID=G4WMV1_WOLAR|nr:putative high-chlorophyll-fluorescence 101 [Wolffia arrhiza]
MRLLLHTAQCSPAPLSLISKPNPSSVVCARAGRFTSPSAVIWLRHSKSGRFPSSRIPRPREEHAVRLCAGTGPIEGGMSPTSVGEAAKDVLKALSQIIDPDFRTDIVSCGFVKDLFADEISGEVSFRLELTTPACPVKDMFERRANEVVLEIPWVKKINVTMSAQPARPIYAEQLPKGLQSIF